MTIPPTVAPLPSDRPGTPPGLLERRDRYPATARSCAAPAASALTSGRARADGEPFVKTAASGSGAMRQQDLRGEFEILMRCRGIPGIPAVLDLTDDGTSQALVMERLPHAPMCCLEISWPRLAATLIRLSRVVWRLARRGVSHDDLRPENILVAHHGEVFLVDFDQATTGLFWRCLLRSLLGVRAGGPPVQNSILAPVRERVQASLSPRAIRWLKGQRLRSMASAAARMPPLPPDAGPRLQALHRAWHLASSSDASAPGQTIAYYALDFEGVRLPSERPWADRWHLLDGVVDCAGKRVIELGCNMALLSVHLLRESGAAAALAVDRDPEILRAAAMVAEAFEAPIELREVNLDGDADWESELATFAPEVVFCLSVLNWVRDRSRLLAFLGRFEELVYEGHDSARTECRRLRAAGFNSVRLVDTSERGRPILHCRRHLNR